jgi:hypothetical protein
MSSKKNSLVCLSRSIIIIIAVFIFITTSTVFIPLGLNQNQIAVAQQQQQQQSTLQGISFDIDNVTFSHHMASVNGIQLHYVIGGKGEPIVLLHGWPET